MSSISELSGHDNARNTMATFSERTKATIHKFNETLSTIRTGRAQPGLLSGVIVEAYGTKTPITQLANINVTDARMLTVEAWDKSLIKEIEKAISEAGLNVSPVVDGNLIRIKLPEMTEENRQKMVKSLNTKLEESRVSIRQAREDEKKSIESQEKNGDITKDDRYSMIENLDEQTKAAISELEDAAEAKEKEIMTI